MAFNPTSPITGAPQTGLTSPTYTFTNDQAPDSNGKQIAVSVAGGTQTGVTVHSVSSPFTHTFTRPKSIKTLPGGNALASAVSNFGKNLYKLLTRKGVTPYLGATANVMTIDTNFNIPVGAETYDIINCRAAISAHIGLLQQVSDGLGATVNTGTI